MIENLYPWQQQVVDEIEVEPDDRSIVWYADEEGCKGKTALCKFLCVRHPGEILVVSGKAADIKYALAELVSKGKDPKAILFHYTRSNEQYVSYEAIEAIKDGLFFSSKYEAKQVVMNCPHVYVFANFLPDTEKLSKDRWCIREMTPIDDTQIRASEVAPPQPPPPAERRVTSFTAFTPQRGRDASGGRAPSRGAHSVHSAPLLSPAGEG